MWAFQSQGKWHSFKFSWSEINIPAENHFSKEYFMFMKFEKFYEISDSILGKGKRNIILITSFQRKNIVLNLAGT